MPESCCNLALAAAVKSKETNQEWFALSEFSHSPDFSPFMFYLFLAIALATALLALDTARRVRAMVSPVPVAAN